MAPAVGPEPAPWHLLAEARYWLAAGPGEAPRAARLPIDPPPPAAAAPGRDRILGAPPWTTRATQAPADPPAPDRLRLRPPRMSPPATAPRPARRPKAWGL